MKKLLILVLAALLVFGIAACKSQEQKMLEDALEEFEDAYDDSLEPNDDDMDDGEAAGVDDGDGNGEITAQDGDSSVVLNGGEWPEDAPIDEPNFLEAQISAVLESPNGAAVTYTGVGRAEAADLIQIYMDHPVYTMLSHTDDSDWEVYVGQTSKAILTIEWESGDFTIMWEQMG